MRSLCGAAMKTRLTSLPSSNAKQAFHLRNTTKKPKAKHRAGVRFASWRRLGQPWKGPGVSVFRETRAAQVQWGLVYSSPLPLCDISGEGSAPSGPAGKVPGLNGAGVDSFLVVGQYLGVVGDENLLRPHWWRSLAASALARDGPRQRMPSPGQAFGQRLPELLPGTTGLARASAHQPLKTGLGVGQTLIRGFHAVTMLSISVPRVV